MMRQLLLVSLLIFCGSCRRVERGADYQERIGIAVRRPGRICMAIRNTKLMPGAAITLIAPAETALNVGARSARALVERRDGENCQDPSGASSYRLTLLSGELEPGQPVVALDARVPAVGPAHSFRECRLGEGVHLTAWEGAKPLEGRRVWHRYLATEGIPGESVCTVAETLR